MINEHFHPEFKKAARAIILQRLPSTLIIARATGVSISSAEEIMRQLASVNIVSPSIEDFGWKLNITSTNVLENFFKTGVIPNKFENIPNLIELTGQHSISEAFTNTVMQLVKRVIHENIIVNVRDQDIILFDINWSIYDPKEIIVEILEKGTLKNEMIKSITNMGWEETDFGYKFEAQISNDEEIELFVSLCLSTIIDTFDIKNLNRINFEIFE